MTFDLANITDRKQSKRESFEELITQILIHEEADVLAVNGAGGDEGIDMFVGNALDGPIDIYQCKYFLGPLSAGQRRQILKSIKTAFSKHGVRTYLHMTRSRQKTRNFH